MTAVGDPVAVANRDGKLGMRMPLVESFAYDQANLKAGGFAEHFRGGLLRRTCAEDPTTVLEST